MSTILYPYQKEDLIGIENSDGRALISWEMGLGKTVVTLAALRRNPDWLPALILCPASLKYQWQREAYKHTGFSSFICETQTPPRSNGSLFSGSSPLTICNYDILPHWSDFITARGFNTLVIDEAQYLTNPKAKRTVVTRRISRKMRHVLALSGTPFMNRLYELWSVLNIIWPHEFPSIGEFANLYCEVKWKPWGWDYSKSKNVQDLHHRLKDMGMFRRRQIDVLKDLPPLTREIVLCDLYDSKEYEEASDDFMGWIKKALPHRARSAARAEALTKVGYLLRLTARLKMPFIVDWVNNFHREKEDKIALFAIHQPAIDVLRKHIDTPSVVIDGRVDTKKRPAIIDSFQDDPGVRNFIGNMHAAGIGTNLTAANHTGICEYWWRPGDLMQTEKRSHRIGQEKPVFAHYFTAAGTIEERLCEILQEKQADISAVLDGGPSSEDLNIYQILLDELTGEAKAA